MKRIRCEVKHCMALFPQQQHKNELVQKVIKTVNKLDEIK